MLTLRLAHAPEAAERVINEGATSSECREGVRGVK